MTAIETMIGGSGTRILNDTSTHPVYAECIALSSDAVISSLKVNGAGTDVKADYVSTAATAAGLVMVLRVIAGKGHTHFSEITLSAGSAVEIKKG